VNAALGIHLVEHLMGASAKLPAHLSGKRGNQREPKQDTGCIHAAGIAPDLNALGPIIP
jgi:hypothetical protein